MAYMKSIAELFKEYELMLEKREELEAELKSGARPLMDKYRAMQAEIVSFCRSAGFLSIMQSLCRINEGALRFSPDERKISYKGRTPSPMAFDCESCFEVKDIAKSKMLAVKGIKDPRDEGALRNLCVGYVTLVAIADSAKELYSAATNACSARISGELDRINAEILKCESELRARVRGLFDANESGIFIGEQRVSSNPELIARMKSLSGVEDIPDEIISLSTRENSSALFVNVSDKEKSSAAFSNFINGIFYKNFLKLGLGELAVAAIEDSGLSSLPLSKMNAGFMVHDKEEANLFSYSYSSVAQDEDAAVRLLDSVAAEMNRRKTLLGSSDSDMTIDEYNAENPYSKKPYILLLMNGFRNIFTSDSAYRELALILKNGGKYGILTVIMDDENNAPVDGVDGAEINLSELGVRTVNFSDSDFKPVSADAAFVDSARRRAKKELGQSEILYLDELLENNPAVSHFSKEITIPIGLSDGKVYYFATSVDATKGEFHASPFTLIIGSTGMGKSAFLHTLILSGAMSYSPDELQYYIVDFKSKQDSAEFACYLHKEGEENLYIPHVKYLSMKSTAENAYDVLDMINTLSDERAALFASVGAKDFIAYNSEARIQDRVKRGELPHVPQIYFLIDEYITMLDGGVGGNEEARAELENKFSDILQRIRTSGVGLIFSGQRCVFKQSTMGLIGNRISFDPGNESLLNAMYNFDYGAGEDGSALYRSISGKIGTAVSTRSAGASHKAIVKTAFAGKHMGERQLALARAIREKYSDPRYYGTQIIPGADVKESADSFLSENAAAPISRTERMLRAQNKELNIPLYIGISAMSSKPIPIRYYLQKQKGALILANPPKQENIEAAAAVNLLHYMAVNGNAPTTPVIILNDMAAKDVLTDEFGNTIDGGSACHAIVDSLREADLSHLVTVNNSATDVAAAIMDAEALWNERLENKSADRKPILLIVHDADELASLQRYLDSEAKAEAEKSDFEPEENYPAPESASDGDDALLDGGVTSEAESLGEFLNVDLSDSDMMMALSNLTNVDINLDDVEVEEYAPKSDKAASSRRFSDLEVKGALRHLIEEGNKQNIFVLISFSNSSVAEKLLGISFSRRDLIKEHCSIVYGSDTVRKTLDVYNDENPDCCFVMPQELKVRLYDVSSDSAAFFGNLKKYYKKN